MHIPGYLTPRQRSPFVDASGWVDDPLFWPAYLLRVGLARTAAEAFAVDPADLDDYLERFDRADAWPVFVVPIGDGTMHVVVRNLLGDVGLDFLLDARVHAAVAGHAAVVGDSTGGGLPWPLLPREPADLLTALPAVGGRAVPDGLPAVVAGALRRVGATASVDTLADELLRHRACLL